MTAPHEGVVWTVPGAVADPLGRVSIRVCEVRTLCSLTDLGISPIVSAS